MLCKSVGRQQLGSVPLSCAIMGGILRGSRVHITLLPRVRQERLVCTHTKVLVIFIVCCCFASDVLSSLVLSPFYPLSSGSAVFQSVCLWFAVLSIHFKFNLMMIFPFSLSVVAFD